jgi:hypothetical protein
MRSQLENSDGNHGFLKVDDRIWRWMKEVFRRNTTTPDDDLEETEGAQILKIYQQIPQGVLRATSQRIEHRLEQ